MAGLLAASDFLSAAVALVDMVALESVVVAGLALLSFESADDASDVLFAAVALVDVAALELGVAAGLSAVLVLSLSEVVF